VRTHNLLADTGYPPILDLRNMWMVLIHDSPQIINEYLLFADPLNSSLDRLIDQVKVGSFTSHGAASR
jgi:hypothetical protein